MSKHIDVCYLVDTGSAGQTCHIDTPIHGGYSGIMNCAWPSPAVMRPRTVYTLDLWGYCVFSKRRAFSPPLPTRPCRTQSGRCWRRHKERALSPPRPSPAAGRPSLVLPAAVDWNAPRIIESGRSERQSIAEEAEPVFWIPNFFLWGPGRTGEESPRKLWKLLVGKQAKKWRYLIACLSTYIL